MTSNQPSRSDTSPDAVSAAGPRALDGEVIPPVIRIANPDREPAPLELAPAPHRLLIGMAVLAGMLVATLSGVCALEGYRWHLHASRAAAGSGAAAVVLAKLGEDVRDLKASVASVQRDGTIEVLRRKVDQLNAEVTAARAASATAVSQLAAKLDTKPAPPIAPAINDVVARLDRLDHDPRVADIVARLDRIEHQVSSPASTGTVAASPRAGSGQTTVAQNAPALVPRLVRPMVLDNWIVRDVYSGIALVEGRTGSVREVVPGETLPGAGEVQSIERRGRGWIVVTSRGIIDTATW